MAIQCIVFNCSSNLDYQTMSRIFSGMAMCGAWSCFDEFNRIKEDILSVIASYIKTIYGFMKEEKYKFVFDGR